MNADVVLQRTMEVQCWRVIARIARATKRPELVSVLVRARENSGTDPDDLAEHLLFEARARRSVADRLCQIAVAYGLLEPRGHALVLTPAGEAAIDTAQVFVPEHGTWTIWASTDPLVSGRILKVDPWIEPSALDELRGTERETAALRRFEKLPGWLHEIVGVPRVPAAAGGNALRIDELERNGEAIEPGGSLRLTWDVTHRRLRLAGDIGDVRTDTVLDAPQTSPEEIWRDLLQGEGLWSTWDEARHSLRVAFAQTSARERESMARDVELRQPSVGGLGQFAPTIVSGVPLVARSLPDAQSWCQWRLDARVSDYATRERYAMWTAEAVAPFDEFRVELPARTTLASAAWRSRIGRPAQRVWHLMAAEDWGL